MSKKTPNKRINQPHVPLQDALEEAKLRLALLKENHTYRELFKETIGTYRAASPSNENAVLLANFADACIRKFGIDSPFGMDTLEVLDPLRDADDDPEKARRILPKLFFSPAIRGVTSDGHHECRGGRPLPLHLLTSRVQRIEPFERLLLVDLRKKRKQLEREFRFFLDEVDAWREEAPEKYESWKADRTRFREEAWQHLKVWRMRRERHGFIDIHRNLGITLDAAKKSFYRAYELIEGRRYDPVLFRDSYSKIGKEELKKTCAECSPEVRDACGASGNLCPDVAAYLDQDIRESSRELIGKSGDFRKYAHEDSLPFGKPTPMRETDWSNGDDE